MLLGLAENSNANDLPFVIKLSQEFTFSNGLFLRKHAFLVVVEQFEAAEIQLVARELGAC